MEGAERVIKIVEHFGSHPWSGVREAARAAKASPASAMRIIKVLAAAGWLQVSTIGSGKHTKYSLTGRISFTTLAGSLWPEDSPFAQIERAAEAAIPLIARQAFDVMKSPPAGGLRHARETENQRLVLDEAESTGGGKVYRPAAQNACPEKKEGD
jgi:hypothetical protein